MKHFRDAFFLLLCLGIGFGLVQAYRYWQKRIAYDFSQKGDHLDTGKGDAPVSRGFTLLAPPAAPRQLFDEWKKLFATTVGVQYSPAWSQVQLAATVKAAHATRLLVVMLPPPLPATASPYGRPLSDIAAEAQTAGVDRLCISWLNADPDPDFWKGQAEAVRSAFKGKIILAATPDIFARVRCWDVADYVGIAGPISLPRRLPHASDDVSVNDLRVAWSCEVSAFESMGLLHQRPVALLNVEVPPDFAIKLSPPGAAPVKPRENVVLQSNVYEALVTETKGRAERTDLLLLTWDGKSDRAVNQIPGLLPQIAAAWDPKKPRPPETEPADSADTLEPDPADTTTAATQDR